MLLLSNRRPLGDQQNNRHDDRQVDDCKKPQGTYRVEVPLSDGESIVDKDPHIGAEASKGPALTARPYHTNGSDTHDRIQ